jgi:transposase
VMERLVLSDASWERMAPLIIGRPDQKGSTGRDNRMFVEGCFGSFVRALPGVISRRRTSQIAPNIARNPTRSVRRT